MRNRMCSLAILILLSLLAYKALADTYNPLYIDEIYDGTEVEGKYAFHSYVTFSKSVFAEISTIPQIGEAKAVIIFVSEAERKRWPAFIKTVDGNRIEIWSNYFRYISRDNVEYLPVTLLIQEIDGEKLREPVYVYIDNFTEHVIVMEKESIDSLFLFI